MLEVTQLFLGRYKLSIRLALSNIAWLWNALWGDEGMENGKTRVQKSWDLMEGHHPGIIHYVSAFTVNSRAGGVSWSQLNTPGGEQSWFQEWRTANIGLRTGRRLCLTWA